MFWNIDSVIQTAAVLSRALTADLQAIGNAHWALYGTHSFRRGGCQYRIRVMGWTTDMIASWGGWTQVEAITMFDNSIVIMYCNYSLFLLYLTRSRLGKFRS